MEGAVTHDHPSARNSVVMFLAKLEGPNTVLTKLHTSPHVCSKDYIVVQRYRSWDNIIYTSGAFLG